MFHYLEDKDFSRRMRETCAYVIDHLVLAINRDDFMKVRATLVGSGAKNLITQNEQGPIDVDYNLEVFSAKCGLKDAKQIKEYIRKMFDKILKKCKWGTCSDSTSCLSTNRMRFPKGNATPFSIDLAIVRIDSEGGWYRLIHDKTGIVAYDRWYWNQAPNSLKLHKKAAWLKKNNYWLAVRESYLNKKNLYLTRTDPDHPSFICYIEAVNEVYDSHHV